MQCTVPHKVNCVGIYIEGESTRSEVSSFAPVSVPGCGVISLLLIDFVAGCFGSLCNRNFAIDRAVGAYRVWGLPVSGSTDIVRILTIGSAHGRLTPVDATKANSSHTHARKNDGRKFARYMPEYDMEDVLRR